jgi:cytochrome c biogenesis protein CcmG/thiol:disulfide interchange protein DsbE
MMSFKKYSAGLIPLVLFIVLSIGLWQGLKYDPHQLPSTLINKPLPAFNLPLLSDPQKRITEKAWLGKPALINVWASWCVTCAAEHEVLMDLAQQKKIAIYGLSYKDAPSAAKEWLEKYGNPYQVVVLDTVGSTAIDLGVYGTPETFLIDKNGIIQDKFVGALTETIWEERVLPRLEKMKG